MIDATEKGIFQGKTRVKGGLLTIGMAAANTIGVALGLPQIAIDAADDTTTIAIKLLVWVLQVVAMYAPTIVTTIVDVVYTKAKTQQNVEGIKANGNGKINGGIASIATSTATAPTAQTQPIVVGGSPQPQPVYETPFNPKLLFSAIAEPYLQWEAYENLYGMLSHLDLHDYHPEARLPLAMAVLAEGLERLTNAWDSELRKAGAIPIIIPPVKDNFDDYDGNENYKLSIMKLIPGCQYLPENIQQVMVGFGRTYQAIENVKLLMGKPIKWESAHTIEDIRRLGIALIG